MIDKCRGQILVYSPVDCYVQAHGQNNAQKAGEEPGKGIVSVRQQGIHQVHHKGQNNQRKNLAAQSLKGRSMERKHEKVVLHKGHKGQGREQLRKSCRLKGIDNDGQNVNGQNACRGRQRVVQIGFVSEEQLENHAHTQQRCHKHQNKLQGRTQVKGDRDNRGGCFQEFAQIQILRQEVLSGRENRIEVQFHRNTLSER